MQKKSNKNYTTCKMIVSQKQIFPTTTWTQNSRNRSTVICHQIFRVCLQDGEKLFQCEPVNDLECLFNYAINVSFCKWSAHMESSMWWFKTLILLLHLSVVSLQQIHYATEKTLYCCWCWLMLHLTVEYKLYYIISFLVTII